MYAVLLRICIVNCALEANFATLITLMACDMFDDPIGVTSLVFGRPFVKRFALCYRTVVCPACLSMTFVHCGQTVGWIEIKLGVQIGLGPGHIVLDGDPAPLPQRGGGGPPIFGPYLLLPNG